MPTTLLRLLLWGAVALQAGSWTPLVLAQPSAVESSRVEAADAESQDEAEDAPEDEASAAGPEDFSDLEALLGEEVVTTASRSAERASAAPATVITIDGDTMRRYGMRSVDEVLAFLGLASFVASSGGDYVSANDIGFQGVLLRNRNRHVLLLIDGHVANASSTGEVRLDVAMGVPLELIDHVEVMLGAGSVSYGSNAMMAVVNVVMRRASDYGRVRAVAEGTLATPTGVDSSVSLGGGGDRWGGRYRLGAGFAREGRLFGHDAELVLHAEWQQEVGATFRVPYQNGEVFDVRPGDPGWGGVGRSRMRTPRAYLSARLGDVRLWALASHYRRTLPFVGTFSEPSTREVLTSLRFSLQHDANPSAEVTLTSRLYGDVVHTDERSRWIRYFYCLPGQQVDGCQFRRRSSSAWVGLEEQLRVDWKLDGRFVTTVGGDLRFRSGAARPADYTDAVTGAGPATVRLPFWQSRSVLGAAFVQQVLRLHERFEANLGARLDADSLFGVHLSPRAALMYLPTARTTVRLGFAEAFRAPSAQELFDTDPTYVVAPDNLSAEVVRTLDLELAQRFSQGSFAVRAFGSILDGLIDARSVTQAEFDAALASGQLVANADPFYVAVWDNSALIRVVGGTFSGRAELVEGLEVGTNLTVAVNDVRGDESLPIIPSFYGNARVAYRVGATGPTLALVGRFSSRRLALNDSGVGTQTRISAGPLGELRLTASGPLFGVTGLTWRAFLNTALSRREPYVLSAGPADDAPDNVRVLGQVPRLFAFLGVSYDLP